jgi:hypothetical protein
MADNDDKPACTGPCKKKPAAGEIGTGAALLGLALGAMIGCAPSLDDDDAQPL